MFRVYCGSMPPALSQRYSTARRTLAWVLLGLILAGIWAGLERGSQNPALLKALTLTKAIFFGVIGYLAVRLFAYFLLDPLLRHRKTQTPGFARDLILVLLFSLLGFQILRHVVQVDLGALLGTGAIVAMVVGLSLQETLGNLFSGIALHLDPAFRVGDWVEVTGNLRGGDARDTLIGQVMGITWRSVQLRTENGDTDIIPNRTIAQSVVTNLDVPAGFHRRTARVVMEPHSELHIALDLLTVALAGIPHLPIHPPEVVVRSYAQGGTVLEIRWFALSFTHSRISLFQALRLASTVLPREGFALMGPCGPNPLHPRVTEFRDTDMAALLAHFELPAHWGPDLQGLVRHRHGAPGEAIIRAGDPGESLFTVLKGSLHVVRPVERQDPYPGLFWENLATLQPGDLFGEASLLTGAPRSATVVAATAVELVEISKAAFETCLTRDPQVVDRLADLMLRRSQSTDAATTQALPSTRDQFLAQIKGWFRLA